MWQAIKKTWEWYERATAAAELPKWVARISLIGGGIVSVLGPMFTGPHGPWYLALTLALFGGFLLTYAGAVTLIGGANRATTKQNTQALAAELAQFARRWHEETAAHLYSDPLTDIRSNQRMRSEYIERFASRVCAMRDKMIAYGLEDHSLNYVYKDPTNALGADEVARIAGAFAERL